MMLENEHPVHLQQKVEQNQPLGSQVPGPLRLSGVGRSYSTPGGIFRALEGVTLTIAPGELVCVVGRSGSGKSTLLHLIAGLDVPTQGSISLAGTDLGVLDESARARFRGRNVGVVFQFFQLLPTLTALENVVLAMQLGRALPRSVHQQRALELLRRFGVEDQAHKFPATLSGGQQQRVALARALANDPAVLLCDEPTGNLDSQSAELVFECLEQLAKAGTTVLVVTHERHYEQRFARVIELCDGHVVRDGAAAKELAP